MTNWKMILTGTKDEIFVKNDLYKNGKRVVVGEGNRACYAYMLRNGEDADSIDYIDTQNGGSVTHGDIAGLKQNRISMYGSVERFLEML